MDRYDIACRTGLAKSLTSKGAALQSRSRGPML